MGKVCKVQCVSLMHGSAQITNAGFETRNPRTICSHEIKPAPLASFHLLCLISARDSLSLSCLRLECFKQADCSEGPGWLGVKRGPWLGLNCTMSRSVTLEESDEGAGRCFEG